MKLFVKVAQSFEKESYMIKTLIISAFILLIFTMPKNSFSQITNQEANSHIDSPQSDDAYEIEKIKTLKTQTYPKWQKTLLISLLLFVESSSGHGFAFSGKNNNYDLETENTLSLDLFSAKKIEHNLQPQVFLEKDNIFFSPDPSILNKGDVQASTHFFRKEDKFLSEVKNLLGFGQIEEGDNFAFMRKCFLVPNVPAKKFTPELVCSPEWVEYTNTEVKSLPTEGKYPYSFKTEKYMPFFDNIITEMKVSSLTEEELETVKKTFFKNEIPDEVHVVKQVSHNPIIKDSMSIASHYHLKDNSGTLILVDGISSLTFENKQIPWYKRVVLQKIPESARLSAFIDDCKSNALKTRMFFKRKTERSKSS